MLLLLQSSINRTEPPVLSSEAPTRVSYIPLDVDMEKIKRQREDEEFLIL